MARALYALSSSPHAHHSTSHACRGAAPTTEARQKGIVELLLKYAIGSIVPIVLLVYYYRDDWGHQVHLPSFSSPNTLLVHHHPPHSPPRHCVLSTCTQYCEKTDLSLWVLVLGWVKMGLVIEEFLVQVWFWQINWKYFTTGGEVAQMKTIKRYKRLQMLHLALLLFHTGLPNQLAFSPSPTG